MKNGGGTASSHYKNTFGVRGGRKRHQGSALRYIEYIINGKEKESIKQVMKRARSNYGVK